jgi:putative addiction module killer protein
MYELRHYTDDEGNDLFAEWLNQLRDRHAKVRVAARLIRLQNGNMGDCKPVGSGVSELRVDWGPGYRVYFAMEGRCAVLLCDGGDKRTQEQDIARAIARWTDWKNRSEK